MKTLKHLLFAALLLTSANQVQAQTIDNILDRYFENTGGVDNWKALKGIKMEGKVVVQGIEIPVEMIQLANGKSMTKKSNQGQDIYQDVFDGNTLWGYNLMTMKPEKSDTEDTENFKNELNDFPSPFLNYKAKGYTVELIGTETIEGTETYKIKLIKEPIKIDGAVKQDISYYYFDKEVFVPIVVEQEIRTGPGKGLIAQTKLGDYKEVDGLYFPFSIAEGAKGMPGAQMISITKITLNPNVDEKIFAFPGSTTTEEKK